MNFWGDALDSFGFSYHHTSGSNSAMPDFTDNMESFKCGIEVVADFCFTEPMIFTDENNNRQYKCNEHAFTSNGGGDQ